MDQEDQEPKRRASYSGWVCGLAGLGVFGWQMVGHFREGQWVEVSVWDSLKWLSAEGAQWLGEVSSLTGALSALPLSVVLLFAGLLLGWLR